MWGYFIGDVYDYEKYAAKSAGNTKWATMPDNCTSKWFKPAIFFELYNTNNLTKAHIYKCLISDVTYVAKLKQKMLSLYPSKKTTVEEVFIKYNF
jgi:hypothetical protein